MANWILIYEAGTHYESEMVIEAPLTEEAMNARVNDLLKSQGEGFRVLVAGFLQVVIKYEPKEFITKLIPRRI